MSIKLGFKKSSIAITALLLSIGMTAKAGVVYDYIKNNNELMIATDANWAPFSYINDAGEMEGFDVDVAREIAKRMVLRRALLLLHGMSLLQATGICVGTCQ